jgi:hypothetical protein
MARIPDEEIERLKREVPIERLVTAAGIELRKAMRRSGRTLPLPRGLYAVAGRLAGEEPVALPGRLPDRRLGDRRELPAYSSSLSLIAIFLQPELLLHPETPGCRHKLDFRSEVAVFAISFICSGGGAVKTCRWVYAWPLAVCGVAAGNASGSLGITIQATM